MSKAMNFPAVPGQFPDTYRTFASEPSVWRAEPEHAQPITKFKYMFDLSNHYPGLSILSHPQQAYSFRNGTVLVPIQKQNQKP